MGRRHRGDDSAISLFPFLSILCCVIGVLTLLIAGVALGQIDDQKDENIEVALQYQTLQRTIQQDKEKLEEFRNLTAEADAIRKLLEDARDEIKRLQKQKSNLQQTKKKEKQVSIKLLAATNRARERISELEPELVKLREAIAKLQKDVKKKKEPKEANVMVRPGGSGVGHIPVFVECTKNGIVIHGTKKKETFIRTADLRKSKDFVDLLARVKKVPKATIVFLLRNDAISTYYAAREVARDAYVNNGKLAVIGHGKLDLSLFRR